MDEQCSHTRAYAAARIHQWHDTDYAAFRERLGRECAMLRVHRDAGGTHSDEWQRRYPEWRSHFTEDEYDAWELDILNRQPQQHAGRALKGWQESPSMPSRTAGTGMLSLPVHAASMVTST
jgi:hypothetical protein